MRYVIKARLVRYILSGILSFIIENSTFLILYYPLHLEVKLANVISICVALTVNFFVSKYYVFEDKASLIYAKKQFVKYTALVAVNLFISTVIVSTLVHHGLKGYLAKPMVTVVIAAWTYIAYKKLVFRNLAQAE